MYDHTVDWTPATLGKDDFVKYMYRVHERLRS